jgi:GH24 family phage-related lysozyme (muramidase)
MIRLRSLLEAIAETKPKVLFVGDSELKTSYNFAKRLMTSKRISRASKIKIKPRADSETLLNILEDNSESHYDLIVLFFNNLQDLKLNQVIENLELSITIAHKHDSRIVLFTLPTLIHLTGKEIPTEKEKHIHHNINNWIRNNSNADFIIDIESDIDDAAYYESNSTTLNAEGHFSIFKRLNKFINQINIDADIDDTKTLDVKQKLSINASDIEEIKQIHQLLLAAGYYIDKNELTNNIIGKTTKLAIRKYNRNINKRGSDDTDTQSDTGLTLINPEVVDGNFSADLVTQAYDLILKYEGFNATAKWDKTNWRIGHGSSTVTLADGSVYRLSNNRSETPTITITKEDADRDLRRRVSDEFIPKVKKSLGDDVMSAWEDGTIAALTSICYNYGSLPNTIIDAAKTKTTSTLVAAVRALGTHNAGINKNRRNKEAAYIETAEGYIPGVSDITDFTANTASTGWNSLTNIVGGLVGTEIFGIGPGRLIGNAGGGDDETWGGSLPKLISILPAGNWTPTSQKRGTVFSKSGLESDHHVGRTDSYAGDFGLNSTFFGDKTKATAFAIAVAQNAGKNIDSWEPYVGKYLNIDSGDYRVQIIWQSWVGGNHYDHVHVGVRKL